MSDRVEKRSCYNCLLRRIEWKDAPKSETGLCSWFLKKFVIPKPIPLDVVEVGCKNWQ